MKNTTLEDIAALLFIILFTYTATSKFLDYELFVFQMRLAPLPWMTVLAPILGWLMPLIETGLVILLLIRRSRLQGIFASVILLVLFEIYIAGMLFSGRHLPCTCGGIISTMTWKQHLLFNGIFILIGLLAIVRSKKLTKRLDMP